jgi:pimeloyl-ACP methyl ester carboxylesterase
VRPRPRREGGLPSGPRPSRGRHKARRAGHRADLGGLLAGGHVLRASATGTGSSWHSPTTCRSGYSPADPENALFRGGVEAFAAEALQEYKRCLRDPETIHAICEDYRAAATIDFAHDAEDREAGRRIACPLLALWGSRGNLQEWYDVPEVWRGWADDVEARAIDSGHYIPEEAPGETLSEIRAFFG